MENKVTDTDLSLLYSMLETPSVGGHEEAIQQHALAFGRPFADQQIVDPVGNVIQVIEPKRQPAEPGAAPLSVLLMGHVDEIGFIVTHIDDRGLIHVARYGGVTPSLYVGAPMQIIHAGSRVCGVAAPTSELRKKGDVSDGDLLIDIGASDKAEAAAAVSIGDQVCADVGVRTLLGGSISARALDDKSGAYVVLEAARRAAEAGTHCRVLAATTVGEENTGRGAYYAAARTNPDCAIVVDVTWCSDAPGTDPADTGDIHLGAGPVLCLSSMVSKPMNALLTELAKEYDIPVQYELAPGRTHTDGDTSAFTGRGVPMALISVPERYMHSSVEVVNLRDLENCVRLLAAFLCRIDNDFDFAPFGTK